jgi:hypothetical protein
VAPDIATRVVDHAKAVARDIVELNREAIELLATELYHRGFRATRSASDRFRVNPNHIPDGTATALKL